jgi:hypothetical protein
MGRRAPGREAADALEVITPTADPVDEKHG